MFSEKFHALLANQNVQRFSTAQTIHNMYLLEHEEYALIRPCFFYLTYIKHLFHLRKRACSV